MRFISSAENGSVGSDLCFGALTLEAGLRSIHLARHCPHGQGFDLVSFLRCCAVARMRAAFVPLRLHTALHVLQDEDEPDLEEVIRAIRINPT
jgi:hypothetical protein